MAEKSLFSQLKERRVFRATLLYVALLWVALQVADLLADDGILDAQVVRWLILLGAAGLPVTIVASWFLEAPWKGRRALAIVSDVVIILAVVVAASLFAWQQWFTSFTRPTVALLRIEATDTRTATADLAAHLGSRLRMALATRPELRVLELSSSRHPQLEGLSVAGRADKLDADLLITGTLAQGSSQLRLTLQVYTADGKLLHSDTYEERITDQAQLQNRVLDNLWPQLPLPGDALTKVKEVITSCSYPQSTDAVLAIAAADAGGESQSLEAFLESSEGGGMPHLVMADALFRERREAPAVQQPVIQSIAMQRLALAETLCPRTPDVELLRLTNSLDGRDDDTLLLRHPNSAALYRFAAEAAAEPDRGEALFNEAKMLDPLGSW